MSRWVKRIAVGAVVILAFGVSGLMCARVGERGRYVGAYSTFGAGPEGTRGLFLLAEDRGAEPVRWAEDLGRLPPRGMLVALGSCQQFMRRELGRIEQENLQAWVEAGGTLVVAGVPDYLSRDGFGVQLLDDPERCHPTEGLLGMLERADGRTHLRKRETDQREPDLEDLPDDIRDDPTGTYEAMLEQAELPEARVAMGTAAPFESVPLVGLRLPLRIEVDERRPRSTLLRLDGPEGEPAAVRVDVGEGAVIVFASASMFQNRDLASQAGGVLFSRLVDEHGSDGPIMFDEFHLGVGQRRSLMRYLRQTGIGPLVLQLLVLIGLVLWRVGARFGAHLEPLAPEPAGTASYVEGVGTLYEKAKDPAGAVRILERRALERIAAYYHLPSREPEALATALERRSRDDAAAAVREIAKSHEKAQGRAGLSKLATHIDTLTKTATSEIST